jgi:hypothetical protein
LESRLSSVPKGTKARASHPITGPKASDPDSCDYHKTRGAQAILTIEKHKVSLLINTGNSIS